VTGTHTAIKPAELPEAIAGREERLATGSRPVDQAASPDRIGATVSTSLTGIPIQSQDPAHLDQMVYEVGE
jgi:hypothetical protein